MSRLVFKVAVAIAAVGLAACSENKVGVTEPDVAISRDIAVNPGSAWRSFTPDNNSAEFWDQKSVDGANCNVGFYAVGPFGPTCAYHIVNTPASGGTWGAGEFLGGSNNGGYSTQVMFDAGEYEVTFLDGYRGALDEQVGYFTKSGSTYTLTPIDPAVSSLIGGHVTFTTNGPWGMWIKPVFAIGGGDGCATVAFPDSMCSDDSKVQQFAAFRRTGDNSEYLVGIEDQPGVATGPGITAFSSQFPLPNGGGDKDFNDFFLSVRKVPPVETLDGRMTGGATNKTYDVKAALTIHCDNKLSNNIEIQGPNNLNFHLDKNSLTNIICQLAENPAPPVAPINIFNGDATGTLNNVPGAKLSFRFVDRGEPGKNDSFSIKIWDKNGVLVLNMPEVPATQGNLQAHFDQPHGQKK